MKFQCYDLHQCEKGERIQVTLRGNAANVRLMDSTNFNYYRQERGHRYIGGLATQSPMVLTVPRSGHWYVTVDLDGLRGSVSTSIRKLPSPLPVYNEPSLASVPSLIHKEESPFGTSEDNTTCLFHIPLKIKKRSAAVGTGLGESWPESMV